MGSQGRVTYAPRMAIGNKLESYVTFLNLLNLKKMFTKYLLIFSFVSVPEHFVAEQPGFGGKK